MSEVPPASLRSTTNPGSAGESVPPSEPLPVVRLTPLNIALGLLKTIRPHQWVKNVFVLAPVVFAKEIFVGDLILRALGAFGVFCVFAGAVYTMNDLADCEADRRHPVKRFRPIAVGQVPRKVAIVFAAALVALGIGGAAMGPKLFLFISSGYFALNVAYSFGLKDIPYLDVGIIALGFVFRVLGGGVATHTPVSTYILACTALLALFLGFGKRRHEFAVAEERKRLGKKQRAVLEAYSKRGLDIALTLAGGSTITTYLVYTLDARTQQFFGSTNLWLTTIFVVMGVARFLYLVRNRPEAESPTQEMLKDGPFVANVFAWVMVVMWTVYNLQPTG